MYKLNDEYDYRNKKPYIYDFSDDLPVVEDGDRDRGNNIIVLKNIHYDINIENSHLYIAAPDSVKIGEETTVLLDEFPLKANMINYYNSFIVDFKTYENKICRILNKLNDELEFVPLICCYLDLGFGELYKNLLETEDINVTVAKSMSDMINDKLTEDFKDGIPKYFTTMHLSSLLKFLKDTNNIDLTTLFIEKYLVLKNSELCFDSNKMGGVISLHDLDDASFIAMQAKNTENVLNFLQALKNSKNKSPYFEDIKAKELEALAVFFTDNKETFSYETQTRKEHWFQIIEALGGILENDNISNKLKVDVAPHLLAWLEKADEVSNLQLTSNPQSQLKTAEEPKEIKKYAENHHMILLKAAACLEKYWSKNNFHTYSFSYFASTLALDASMSGQRKHMTFRYKTILFGFLISRFNKFLENEAQATNGQGFLEAFAELNEEQEINGQGLLETFSKLTDDFIPELRYFVFSDYACYDDLAIMLYQLASLLKNNSITEADAGYAKNIIKIYCEKIDGEKPRLPDYVLYEDKKINVESIIYYSYCFVDNGQVIPAMKDYLNAIKDYLPHSTWDEADKKHEKIGPIYYNKPSILHTSLFVLLAAFSIFSMLLYTNAAASIILKTQLPFMISYGFLLKGALGIVMPALSLVVVFFACQAYKSIFTMKIDNMRNGSDYDSSASPASANSFSNRRSSAESSPSPPPLTGLLLELGKKQDGGIWVKS
ncbi:MAG: hypothetical protein HON55_00400 [Legionellales bacterium]|nr:hypothetical protein [Legionellales bacterium]